jgi:hypothetical protein
MAVETEKNGKPIELDWCCGVNTKINIVDLTPRDQTHTIAYAVNHLVVIQVSKILKIFFTPEYL